MKLTFLSKIYKNMIRTEDENMKVRERERREGNVLNNGQIEMT